MPKKDKCITEFTTIGLTSEQYNALKEYSRKHEMTISQIFRKHVKDLVNNEVKNDAS